MVVFLSVVADLEYLTPTGIVNEKNVMDLVAIDMLKKSYRSSCSAKLFHDAIEDFTARMREGRAGPSCKVEIFGVTRVKALDKTNIDFYGTHTQNNEPIRRTDGDNESS